MEQVRQRHPGRTAFAPLEIACATIIGVIDVRIIFDTARDDIAAASRRRHSRIGELMTAETPLDRFKAVLGGAARALVG